MKYWKSWALIALVVLILKNVLEFFNAPSVLILIVGVTWLGLIVPLVLGYRVATDGNPTPFKALFMEVFLYTLAVRFFVAVNYVIAKAMGSDLVRITGVVGGDEVSFGWALVLIGGAFLLTTIAGTLVGWLLGALMVLIFRSKTPATA